MKWSEKVLATSSTLADIIGLVGSEKRIALENLATNWLKIQNKPSVFPVDGGSTATISAIWTFAAALKKTVDSKINPGASVDIEMPKCDLLYIEPDMNFTLNATVMHEGDFMVVVKQPVAGGMTMSLNTGEFAYSGSAPTLSVAGNAIDVLVFRYNASIGRAVLLQFLPALTLN